MIAYENNNVGDYSGCRLWIDNTDHYIGLRYSTNIDTAYGWIRVRVTATNGITVRSFALEKNPIVGLHELSANNVHLTVYPNPVSGVMNVELGVMNGTEVDIFVYDVLGNTVIHNSTLITHNSASVDVSALPNGIYFAQVKTNKGVGAKKIVIAK